MSAYLILDLTIHDFEIFREYIQKIPRLIEKHLGKYSVQGEEPAVIEGDWKPERVVVIEFSLTEQANAFLKDPDAQKLFKVRHKSTTSKLILVGGV